MKSISKLYMICLICVSGCKNPEIERPPMVVNAPNCIVLASDNECQAFCVSEENPVGWEQEAEGLNCTEIENAVSFEDYIESLELEIIRLRRRCKL